MACTIDIVFDDTASVTWAGSGTEADPLVATATGVGGGSGAINASITQTGNTITITQTGGPDIALDLCSVAGGNGLTGQQVGAEIVGCTSPDLGGQTPTAAGYDPVDFPEFWRQTFVNGVTGSETFTVLRDAAGVKRWRENG